MGLPKLESWHVEGLRFSFFFNVPVNAQQQSWWEIFANGQAEAKVNKPQIGEYSETGIFLGGQCELKVAFNRIDWSVSFPFAGLPHAPSHSDVVVQLSKWLSAASRWLASAELSPQRIALGVGVFVLAKNEEESNSVLQSYLPFVDLAGKNLIDVAMQVNSPTVSENNDGLMINRLVRFATMKRQLVNVSPAGIPIVETDSVLKCDLDINTSPERLELFDVRSSVAVIEEMVRSAESILTKSV